MRAPRPKKYTTAQLLLRISIALLARGKAGRSKLFAVLDLGPSGLRSRIAGKIEAQAEDALAVRIVVEQRLHPAVHGARSTMAPGGKP